MVKIPDIFELLGAKPSHGLDPTELRRFLAGAGPRNRNLDIGPYSAYLRRSMPREPTIGDKLKRPLDLASIGHQDKGENVEFAPAGLRPPRGKFKELMTLLEDEARQQGYDSVYVEQIFNKFLPDVLKGMGYRLDERAAPMNPETPSLFKRLDGPVPGSAWARR